MTLPDTVAVVTGASEGIGRAVAHALVAAGATVHGFARSPGPLAATADALGPRFIPATCDVTDAAAVRQAIDAAHAHAGRLDVLVNNAGVGAFGPVDEVADADWDRLLGTNLSGLFYATRAAVPHMKAAGRGHIVHVASIAGIVGNANLSAYNATKFGVRGFSEATMKELRPHGIRVTCVLPGSVATDFGGSPAKDTAIPPEAVAATIRHTIEAPDSTLISEVVMRPMAVS